MPATATTLFCQTRTCSCSIQCPSGCPKDIWPISSVTPWTAWIYRRFTAGAGDGSRNQPFYPAMMVKLLLYGYATGVFSSRKLARKLRQDIAFCLLGAGNFPAHCTLIDFRAFHLLELSR